MSRTQSTLSTYTQLSPNCTKPRTSKIRRLTPHCVAGNLSMESILGLSRFVNYDANGGASCNYAIATDGRIGLGVEETNRSWCTSSRANDMEAITFEIANNGGAPDWSMSDEAINAWLDLSVDIAKFYGYTRVAYQEKPSNIPSSDVEKWISTWAPADVMIITLHCWYANKACPGPYFIRQIPRLVEEINKRLSDGTPDKIIGENVTSPPLPTDTQTPTAFEPYLIRVNVTALNVRKGPGTNHEIATTLINDKNIYTVTEEADGQGASKWLKLKSGIGWVSKDFVSKR